MGGNTGHEVSFSWIPCPDGTLWYLVHLIGFGDHSTSWTECTSVLSISPYSHHCHSSPLNCVQLSEVWQVFFILLLSLLSRGEETGAHCWILTDHQFFVLFFPPSSKNFLFNYKCNPLITGAKEMLLCGWSGKSLKEEADRNDVSERGMRAVEEQKIPFEAPVLNSSKKGVLNSLTIRFWWATKINSNSLYCFFWGGGSLKHPSLTIQGKHTIVWNSQRIDEKTVFFKGGNIFFKV